MFFSDKLWLCYILFPTFGNLKKKAPASKSTWDIDDFFQPQVCKEMKTAFDDVDDFNKKGGLKAMGESSAGPLLKNTTNLLPGESMTWQNLCNKHEGKWGIYLNLFGHVSDYRRVFNSYSRRVNNY